MQETQETWIRSLGQEDPLEEGMATYSSYSSLDNLSGVSKKLDTTEWLSTAQHIEGQNAYFF